MGNWYATKLLIFRLWGLQSRGSKDTLPQDNIDPWYTSSYFLSEHLIFKTDFKASKWFKMYPNTKYDERWLNMKPYAVHHKNEKM